MPRPRRSDGLKLLLVDDEAGLVKGLTRVLENEGFHVATAFDGRTALEILGREQFDLVLLDLMLPEVDGLSVCRQVRASSSVPIIMLTAKGEDVDKIVGLELGADDYMTKPFNARELVARIRAVLRRFSPRTQAPGPDPAPITLGPLVLDPDRRQVFRDGREVEVTAREFELLLCLARRPGRVFTRNQLLELVWGYEYLGDSRAVDVQVSRLRQKIEDDPDRPVLLKTKWGVGYYLATPEA
ncbi:MAG: response regulator transcription factor [Bacillota bacterium]